MYPPLHSSWRVLGRKRKKEIPNWNISSLHLLPDRYILKIQKTLFRTELKQISGIFLPKNNRHLLNSCLCDSSFFVNISIRGHAQLSCMFLRVISTFSLLSYFMNKLSIPSHCFNPRKTIFSLHLCVLASLKRRKKKRLYVFMVRTFVYLFSRIFSGNIQVWYPAPPASGGGRPWRYLVVVTW